MSTVALPENPVGRSAEGADAATPQRSLPATIPEPSQPESFFDAVNNKFKPVAASVEIHANEQGLDTGSPSSLRAGGADVLTMAGTFGDISRYLQIFPGVVASSDLSNQMLVRGGHPMENLFLVDGIEVPNINHLANANTTGGLGPMIDAAAIQGLNMYTGGFDARFPERLSSVTEFHTLDSPRVDRHLELDFGIQGVGGLVENKMHGGDLLLSAHHGLLDLVSSNVGLNGVPSYTNALTRFRTDASGNHFSFLNLVGRDSIEIEPCASDSVETSTINSQYSGWRETTGVELQHVYSSHSFGTLNLSDSEQIEHIHQQDQISNPLTAAPSRYPCPIPHGKTRTIPVYREDSNNAFSTAKYLFEWASSRMTLTAGSAVWLQRPSFDVAQPTGMLSPYLDRFSRTDSASFDSHFSTGESGSNVQLLVRPFKALSLSAGGRVQTFAMGNHVTVTPRLNANYQLAESAGIHITYATYAQMPPYAYMLAYPGNRSMLPMRATHEIMGMDLGMLPHSQIHLEAYNKDYRDIPASTEFPAVTLHTMVEMIGEQIVWLPMNSGGHGTASGIELSDMTRIGSHFQTQGSIAYSRAKFAGTDGKLRPSNFDFPWIGNVAGNAHLTRGMVISMRYGYATGRPYTPFNMTASLAQNRPIYDLARVNVPRAPYYSRLDAQVSKDVRLGRQHLEIYAGVDNILNRSNFLSYAWMPIYGLGYKNRNPVGTLWQTPIFPNFGIRLIVR